MNTPELIVRTLDAAGNSYEEDNDHPEIKPYADLVRAMYRDRRTKTNFSAAAREARIAAVRKIINDSPGPWVSFWLGGFAGFVIGFTITFWLAAIILRK